MVHIICITCAHAIAHRLRVSAVPSDRDSRNIICIIQCISYLSAVPPEEMAEGCCTTHCIFYLLSEL